MKKMLCPQCKIAAMYVKNEAGERRLVYVTSEGEVVPKKEDESLEGFDLNEVFCLGAWKSQTISKVLIHCCFSSQFSWNLRIWLFIMRIRLLYFDKKKNRNKKIYLSLSIFYAF